MTAPTHSSIAGFTLIETLAATALMGMIMVLLAMISAQWMPNWNRGMARVQQDEDLALAIDRVAADLAAAEFVPASRQVLQPFFVGKSSSVTFVRTALSPNARAGLEFVRFAEVRSDHGAVLVRTQAPFALLDAEQKRTTTRFTGPITLIRAPYRISFAYAGLDRVWRDEWQRQPLLPRAVRLTVRDTNTQRAIAASTATLLHVEIPADCIAAKSFADCVTSRQGGMHSADATTAAPRVGSSP
jgi:general secretion pathway protein J